MSKKKIKQDNIKPASGKIEQRWVPTIGGKTIGYIPEYKSSGDAEWLRIPTETRLNEGIPYPYCEGGIFRTVHLYGYAQAQALAWTYKAICEANGNPFIEIRVADYDVVFDIKARRIDESDTKT